VTAAERCVAGAGETGMNATDNYDPAKDRERRRKASIARTQLAAMMTLALMAGGEAGAPELPRLPEPKPPEYKVHLAKAERKGKTPEQLQAMRQARKQEEKSNG